MVQVVIVGTSGTARETAAWVDDVGRGSDLIGFLDDTAVTSSRYLLDKPVLGGLGWLAANRDTEVVVGLPSPARRAIVVDHVGTLGVRLAGLVHPSATVGPDVTMRSGAIIGPRVLLAGAIRVGRAALVDSGAIVGHRSFISDCAVVGPGVRLAEAVTIGAQVEVGIGATVAEGVTIGDRAVLGPGVIVTRSVASGMMVVAEPARAITEEAHNYFLPKK